MHTAALLDRHQRLQTVSPDAALKHPMNQLVVVMWHNSE